MITSKLILIVINHLPSLVVVVELEIQPNIIKKYQRLFIDQGS